MKLMYLSHQYTWYFLVTSVPTILERFPVYDGLQVTGPFDFLPYSIYFYKKVGLIVIGPIMATCRSASPGTERLEPTVSLQEPFNEHHGRWIYLGIMFFSVNKFNIETGNTCYRRSTSATVFGS